MKAAVLAVSSMILFAPLSLANDGYISGVGGTLAPMEEHPSIQLVFEQVNIDLRPETAEVACTFVFKNTGEATTVKMGFPESRWGDTRGTFSYFRTRVDGKSVTAKQTVWDSQEDGGDGSRWWIKEVHFERDQTRVVEDYYGAPTGSDIFGTRSFEYTLKTGRSWHGPIQKGVVTVNLGPEGLLQTVRPEPEGYTRDGNRITWAFENLEPDRNIRLAYSEKYGNFVVDGKDRTFPYGWALSGAPTLEDGVLMGSGAYLARGMGLEVDTAEEDESVTLSGYGKTVHLKVGSPVATAGAEQIRLPRAPEARESRGWGPSIAFPLAPVARAFGATVWFDRETKKTYVWRPGTGKETGS